MTSTRDVLAMLHAHTAQLAVGKPQHVTVAGLLGEPEDTPADELLELWADLLHTAVDALDTAASTPKTATPTPDRQIPVRDHRGHVIGNTTISYTGLGAQQTPSTEGRRYDRRRMHGGVTR